MQVKYHKKFDKRFQKLPPVIQIKTKELIIIFQKNPFDSRLRNHALSGKMSGRRAICVTASIRIIFKEYGGYISVLFLDIGTHPQVYK